MSNPLKFRTETSDDSLISAEDRTSTAWFDFVREMEERRYGPQETLDAWSWFKVGWSRGSEYHSLPHTSRARRAEEAAKKEAAPVPREGRRVKSSDVLVHNCLCGVRAKLFPQPISPGMTADDILATPVIAPHRAPCGAVCIRGSHHIKPDSPLYADKMAGQIHFQVHEKEAVCPVCELKNKEKR